MGEKRKSRPLKRRPVKPKSDHKIHNIYHPDYNGKIQFSFESKGIKYYSFKSDTDNRYGRYVILQTFLQEYLLRTDLDTLKSNIKSLKKFLNPTVGKDGTNGSMQIGKAFELLDVMEQQAEIAFEPETVYRLASCLYFDDKEILTGYDKEYNDKKIACWKEANSVDFFFDKAFQELTNLRVTSKEGLLNYLDKVPQLLGGWKKMRDLLKQ
jgi:hypothetical protein